MTTRKDRAMTDQPSNVEPTPRPWRKCRFNAIESPGRNTVVAMARKGTDRDLIVRAVNAHDDLVALAQSIASLNPYAGEIGPGLLRQIVAQARRALAKIEQENSHE